MHRRSRSLGWAVRQAINRGLQGVSLRYDRGFAKPARIIFCLTLRCNIKCRQCAIWRLPKGDELTTDEWKKVIDDLKAWLGTYRVQLAGGETFVRKDVTQIVRHASDRGILTGVVTNGTLITPELARDIVASGLGYIHVSIDGIKPETHDYIRGVPDVHEKATKGIDYLLEAAKGSGMSVNIATVVMKKNMHELLDLVQWVEDKGLDGIIFNPLGPTVDSDPEWFRKTDLWFDDLSRINEVLDALIALKKSGAKILNPPEQFEEMKVYFEKGDLPRRGNCMVGVTNLSITCDGAMHMCFKMPALGNVQQVSPREAWNSQHASDIRKKIRACDIHCSPGNFIYRRRLISEIMRYMRFG